MNPHGKETEKNPASSFSFAERITAYLQQEGREGILRPHQREVFTSFQDFFMVGHTRGFIDLPTGTGKTVLFVELSKALIGESEGSARPKILVVAPTKDLVNQTMGKTGQKGYGKFAPDLKVGSYFTDTPYDEKSYSALDKNDVVVTTYASFNLLHRRQELRPITDEELEVLLKSSYFSKLSERWGYETALMLAGQTRPTGRTWLDRFDVFILDEAHHTMGGEAGKIVNLLPMDKVIIGFTATPDAGEFKKLTRFLPNRIHTLGLNEAIWMELLAPIVPLGVKSGIRIRGSDLYDESGDFIDNRIKYLAESPARNKLILQAAKAFVENGVGTIISCIAGDGAHHARYLARELQEMGVRAEAVFSGVDSKVRQQIYAQFERGDIDVLTFIGVLGEGWDSSRAKAIINARPTRSLIFSKQRLGRITRPGNVAFAIDILDEYDEYKVRNPAITVADVLDEGDISLGKAVGKIEDTGMVSKVLESIGKGVPLEHLLESKYDEYRILSSGLEMLTHGVLAQRGYRMRPEYALPSVIYTIYKGVTEEILLRLEQINNVNLDKKLARQGNAVRTVYRIDQARGLLEKMPKIDPNRYFTDEYGMKRISAQGLVVLFSKRFPSVSLPIIEHQLEKVEGDLDWVPARHQVTPDKAQYKHFTVVKMYQVNEKTIDFINQSLTEYFKQA